MDLKILKDFLFVILLLPSLCFAQVSEQQLFAAYQQENMLVWKNYIDSVSNLQQRSGLTSNFLSIEYGYCGYIVAEAKKDGQEALLPEAKQYVQLFRQHIEDMRQILPVGHYEMYMSAVYVYELRLHESIHPVKAMSLAKDATKLAPQDPIVLSYYGTCLFYAPKPFGSKAEALEWFEKAEIRFRAPEWEYCWIREANEMYIKQCREKLKMQ